MSPERWARISPLLDIMLDLEPEARTQFLNEQSAGDGALREELSALVAHCEQADSMLDAPAAARFATLLVDEIELPPVVGSRYRIVQKIGQGGMASVFLAEDAKHGRQVAVKVLHADVAHMNGRKRFEQEIGIAAGLSHPHILALHDSGEVTVVQPSGTSLPYFVSPFVAGETLRERLRRERRLSVSDATRIAGEIAVGLDYAHRQGIIHLDIKPENILLFEGQAIIADFGIARAMCPVAGSECAMNAATGTPAYMSTEHRAGDDEVDGRSDIYSLGCVLYEMIVGEPYRNPDDVEANNVDESNSQLNAERALREHASSALSKVVLRAVSQRRDKRFATGAEMAAAIRASLALRERPRWYRTPAVLLLAVLAAIGAPFAQRVLAKPPAFDSDLIAVAPFDVAAPALSLWHEGMVDVLARNLDGAGPLRSVAASTVIRGWSGRADAESAQALGERTGAGLVVFGGLIVAGDSVRATAALYDASSGQKLGEFERSDLAERMDRLSDSLTVSVVRELSLTRRIDVARATAAPTTSIVALKLYLQGEQLYRSAQWDSAKTLYYRATQIDTAFALAYHRLAAVLKPGGVRDPSDSLAHALMRMPERFRDGLAPREQLLAAIDSLSADAYFTWNPGKLAGNGAASALVIHALYAAIDSALVQYPNDPEFAYIRADARARYEQDVGYGEFDDRALIALFDRSIALDSSFAPAYVVPVAGVSYLDGPDEARRYVQAYRSQKGRGGSSRVMRFAEHVFGLGAAREANIAELIARMTPDELCGAGRMLRHIPDSTEMVRQMARAMLKRSKGPPQHPQSGCVYTELVEGLQFRGHLQEAYQLASLEAHYLRPTVMMGMEQVGAFPTDSARQTFKRILSLAPRLKIAKLMAWWATDGDTAAITTYLRAYESEVKTAQPEAKAAMLRANASAARAYLLLARRDTAGAVRQYLTGRDTVQACWGENRSVFATILTKVARSDEAARLLARRWPGTSNCSSGLDDVMWTLQRARLFDRSGKVREAVREYAFVEAAWRNADVELQPVVLEARRALARLNTSAIRASM